MQALHDVVQAGYVRYIGMSSCHAWQCSSHAPLYFSFLYVNLLTCTLHAYSPCDAKYVSLFPYSLSAVHYLFILFLFLFKPKDYAITNKLTPFISMQNHYSLVYREEEREMFPTLKHFGVGSIPWSPLARGFLTRPLGEQTDRGKVDRMIGGYGQTEGNKTIVGRVEEIAKKKGVTMAQIAVAWAMARDGMYL